MSSDPRRLSNMMRILRIPISDEYLEQISGTAPLDVKAMTVKWLNVYHAPAPKCFAGMSAKRTIVKEVSLNREQHAQSRLQLVSEIEVTEELLDRHRNLAQAFIVTIIDECVSSAVSTVDYAEGGPGISPVSLSLNTTFHNPATLGSTLRLISTTIAAAGGIQSCGCEVWDLREQRLVANAVYSGMLSSAHRARL
ncbi:hypothetical protein MIND_01179300 [Mycena indigotica]|uniref:Thioesterase domain-containing protein n=1 Tax=Mycena indigotica TaxID=2126181 RepID=A0A8H6S4L3_9AGAR|nr:uncharacterized protein MIND_01179300 [Mycena indigotica]KAF7292804.1 hypothetical protein MIND_01179300 [Mycena indigotica]